MDNITAAHIHLGEFRQNCNIIVPLLKSSTPVDMHNGTLVEDKVTSADLVGPLTGKTITELVQLFNNSKTYVNIHTEQYTNGELRREIKTVNATNW